MNAIAQTSALPVSGRGLDNRRVLAALIDVAIVAAGTMVVSAGGELDAGARAGEGRAERSAGPGGDDHAAEPRARAGAGREARVGRGAAEPEPDEPHMSVKSVETVSAIDLVTGDERPDEDAPAPKGLPPDAPRPA